LAEFFSVAEAFEHEAAIVSDSLHSNLATKFIRAEFIQKPVNKCSESFVEDQN